MRPTPFDGHRPRNGACRRHCDIIACMWTPLPDPRSSRWLGPELVVEVLARTSFGGSDDDAPRWTTLSHNRGRRPPLPSGSRKPSPSHSDLWRSMSSTAHRRAVPSTTRQLGPGCVLRRHRGFDAPDQNHASATRFRGDSIRSPERLPSCRKPAAFHREPQQLPRVIHARRGAFCTHSPGLLRDAASTAPRLPPGYAALPPGPCDREPENDQRCIRPTSAIHISKTSTRTSCEDQLACGTCAPCSPVGFAVHALHPLRPAVSSPRQVFSSRPVREMTGPLTPPSPSDDRQRLERCLPSDDRVRLPHRSVKSGEF